jgi:hypothetical protein
MRLKEHDELLFRWVIDRAHGGLRYIERHDGVFFDELPKMGSLNRSDNTQAPMFQKR